jgi:acylpyruvate hydrolase
LKLVNYAHKNLAALGIVFDNQVAELVPALEFYSMGGQLPVFAYSNLLGLLQDWDGSFQILDRLHRRITNDLGAGVDLPFLLPLASLELNPPVQNPGKIVCMGLNYADHCREQNLPLPESIILFAKFPSCLIGPEQPVTWPEGASQQVDYEAELAVVIGKECRNVPAASALEMVAGYMVANDISARDVQFADKQWVRGKSFDTFCPAGPYLVTREEIEDPQNLWIRCWVNGEIRQDSNTAEMIFTIPEAIEFISRTSTLLPGDIILTGTPDGVGVFSDPQVFLKKGDRIEVEIENLGRLANPVA